MVHMQYLFIYNVSDICNLIGAGCQERLDLVSSNMDLLTSNVESQPWGFCMIAFIARKIPWKNHWNSMECLHGVRWYFFQVTFSHIDISNVRCYLTVFLLVEHEQWGCSQAINAAERRRSRAAMCRCQGRSWGSCPWLVELQTNLFGHMTLRNVVGVVALWHPSMCFVRCTNVSWFALNLNQSLQQKVVVDCRWL